MNHYFQTLELHKVLERLAEETSNSCTRQMALEIEPSADPARVQQLLGMTEDALQLSIQYGTPPFYQMEDVCAPLLRAKSGSRISLRELLSVARLVLSLREQRDLPGISVFPAGAQSGTAGQAGAFHFVGGGDRRWS